MARSRLPTSTTTGRTCYVAAHIDKERWRVADVLNRHGYRLLAPTDLPLYGLTAAEAVISTIEQADLVLAFVDDATSNVFFEMGIAVALGKPLIVVAESPQELPFDVGDMSIVHAPRGDLSSLELLLSQLERVGTSVLEPKRRQTVPEPPARRSAVINTLLQRLRAADAPPRQNELVDIVLTALQESDLIVAQAKSRAERFDIGVWSNESGWIVGNPLLVEVVATLRSVADLQDRLARASSAIVDTNAQWVLLIYHRGLQPPTVEEVAQSFPVLTFRLEDMLEELRSHSFPALLRNLRNRRVHGVV
jgi:Nucleoside 2-deoxyribosyltransferase